MNGQLRRVLRLRDAVVVGLGSMIGAGVFVALSPAAAAAGSGLPLALALAGLVAYLNASSTARLAACHPQAGGAYVYGRDRLGPWWGFLAGWSFVAGKSASCAAMALTVGAYAWPDDAHRVAVLAVLALTGLNVLGVQKSVVVARLILGIVIAVLLAVVALTVPELVRSWPAMAYGWEPRGDIVAALGGVVQGAGLLFFAFAGYARIATLGEEVIDPARTIPRAIGQALALALILYVVVAVAVSGTLGIAGLAATPAYLSQTAVRSGQAWLVTAVAVAAVLAAVGSLLSLILGVSRTALALARDGHLPRVLAAVNPQSGVPVRAELAVGLVVAAVAATVDLRDSIGFSSFAVLLYYAVAHASASRLTLAQRRPPRVVWVSGLVGCLVLAAGLPRTSVYGGLVITAIGAAAYAITGWRRSRRHLPPAHR